jgi:hypothetical protein
MCLCVGLECRMYMAQDRFTYYFSPIALLDFITIVPGYV